MEIFHENRVAFSPVLLHIGCCFYSGFHAKNVQAEIVRLEGWMLKSPLLARKAFWSCLDASETLPVAALKICNKKESMILSSTLAV